MEITTTRKASRVTGLNVLVYGPAGAGKTTLCNTTGDPEHRLILSAEAGLMALRDFDIPVVVIRSMDDLVEVYEMLAKGGHGYTWVCIDSLTEVAEVCLEEEMAENSDPRKAYGGLANRIFKLIRLFRNLEVNLYCSAKQDRITDDGRLVYAPDMPGRKLGPGLPYHFTQVFALRVHRNEDGTVRRMLQTQPDEQYDAKDTSGVLEQFEAPDLGAVAAKVFRQSVTDNTPQEE